MIQEHVPPTEQLQNPFVTINLLLLVMSPHSQFRKLLIIATECKTVGLLIVQVCEKSVLFYVNDDLTIVVDSLKSRFRAEML